VDVLPEGARFTSYLDHRNEALQKRMAKRFVNERTLETTKRLQVIARASASPLPRCQLRGAVGVAYRGRRDHWCLDYGAARRRNLKACDLILDAATLQRVQRSTMKRNPNTDDGRWVAEVVEASLPHPLPTRKVLNRQAHDGLIAHGKRASRAPTAAVKEDRFAIW